MSTLREASQQALEALDIEKACDIIAELSMKLTELDLIAAAQREKVAHWMRSLGYATGHGDTIEEMLDHLGTQIAEGLEAEVLMEREACAVIAETPFSGEQDDITMEAKDRIAAAIRARSKT